MPQKREGRPEAAFLLLRAAGAVTAAGLSGFAGAGAGAARIITTAAVILHEVPRSWALVKLLPPRPKSNRERLI